jgi:branched-subunit amino acid permease
MGLKYVLQNYMLLVALIIFAVIYIIINYHSLNRGRISFFEGNFIIPIIYTVLLSLVIFILSCDGDESSENTYKLVKVQEVPYYKQFNHKLAPDLNIKSLLKSDSVFIPQLNKNRIGLKL